VRRAEVRRLMAEFSASERRACELMEIARMSCRYRSRRDDGNLREGLLEWRERSRVTATGGSTCFCEETGLSASITNEFGVFIESLG